MSYVACNLQGPSKAHFGLGNQMFGIAATLSYAHEHGKTAVFPCLNDVSRYGNYRDSLFNRLSVETPPLGTQFAYYKEPNFTYDKLPLAENLLIEGYFQSQKYFGPSRELILDTFKFPKDIENYAYSKYSRIMSNPNTVGVHVRRGDYISDFNGCFEILDNEYYDKAFSQFADNSTFVFFGESSEDLEHCKGTMNTKRSFYVHGETDVVDMYLMSKMRNNIIANSSFSWWAAWLNENKDKKVIAPQKWFGKGHPTLSDNDRVTRDLIPINWERI